MSDAVIIVDALSKSYHIGTKERHGRTFREAFTETLAAPFRRIRSIGNGSNANGAQETFWALKDVSFEVKRGEVVGIIGRNGAGKSTLLKILSRITEPTSGTVRLRGRVASLLEVGTGFHAELTGRENIYLNGAVLGMKRAEITRKFDEIVAFAEVDKFLDTPVKRYSSGMYVRLAFAVAAHLEPEILIVDEVLAVGDAEFQKKCLGKMKDVAQGQGRTVLFVSHNMAAVLELCDSCRLIQAGQIALIGSPEQTVQAYVRSGTDSLEAVVDLAKLRRPMYVFQGQPQVASLETIELMSKGTEGPWRSRFGRDLHFKIVIRVHRELDDVEIGPSLFDARDFEIASSLSSHAIKTQPLTQGLHEFSVLFRGLRLLPGRYYLGVGIRANARMVDYLRPAVEFEVTPTEEGNGKRINTLKGAILAVVDYECKRIDPEGKTSA